MAAGERGAPSCSPPTSSSPPYDGVSSPELGPNTASLFLTRSDSTSSGGSARSTGTVCDESAENPAAAGGRSPRERELRSTEPPSRVITPRDVPLAISSPQPGEGASMDKHTTSRSRGEVAVAASNRSWSQKCDRMASNIPEDSSKTADGSFEARPPTVLLRKGGSAITPPTSSVTAAAAAAATPLPRMQPGRQAEISTAAAGTSATSGDPEEDTQSVSTVSGSGIDFFRKFVQRKGSGCKECEDQFRREVLIDRLVADSLHSKAVLAGTRSTSSCRTSASSSASGLTDAPTDTWLLKD